MHTAFIVGRIVLGLYWLQTAYSHIAKPAGLVGYAQMKGIKSAKLAVIGTGVLALIGAVTILTGYQVEYGVACLVIFLAGVSWKMHAFWKVTDPMAKMGDTVNFYKNVAMAASLLMLLAIPFPWTY